MADYDVEHILKLGNVKPLIGDVDSEGQFTSGLTGFYDHRYASLRRLWNSEEIKPIYDKTATYEPGMIVTHEDGGIQKLYYCTETTTGEFDPTKWVETDLSRYWKMIYQYAMAAAFPKYEELPTQTFQEEMGYIESNTTPLAKKLEAVHNAIKRCMDAIPDTGEFYDCPEYQPELSFKKNEVFYSEGKLYRAIQDIPQFDTNWKLHSQQIKVGETLRDSKTDNELLDYFIPEINDTDTSEVLLGTLIQYMGMPYEVTQNYTKSSGTSWADKVGTVLKPVHLWQYSEKHMKYLGVLPPEEIYLDDKTLFSVVTVGADTTPPDKKWFGTTDLIMGGTTWIKSQMASLANEDDPVYIPIGGGDSGALKYKGLTTAQYLIDNHLTIQTGSVYKIQEDAVVPQDTNVKIFGGTRIFNEGNVLVKVNNFADASKEDPVYIPLGSGAGNALNGGYLPIVVACANYETYPIGYFFNISDPDGVFGRVRESKNVLDPSLFDFVDHTQPFPQTITLNDLTIVANEDGSLTINGTASDVTQLFFVKHDVSRPVRYPTNWYATNSGISPEAKFVIKSGYPDLTRIAEDKGNGVTYHLDRDDYNEIYLEIAAGTSFVDTLIRPMIRYEAIRESTWESYGEKDIDLRLFGQTPEPIPYHSLWIKKRAYDEATSANPVYECLAKMKDYAHKISNIEVETAINSCRDYQMGTIFRVSNDWNYGGDDTLLKYFGIDYKAVNRGSMWIKSNPEETATKDNAVYKSMDTIGDYVHWGHNVAASKACDPDEDSYMLEGTIWTLASEYDPSDPVAGDEHPERWFGDMEVRESGVTYIKSGSYSTATTLAPVYVPITSSSAGFVKYLGIQDPETMRDESAGMSDGTIFKAGNALGPLADSTWFGADTVLKGDVFIKTGKHETASVENPVFSLLAHTVSYYAYWEGPHTATEMTPADGNVTYHTGAIVRMVSDSFKPTNSKFFGADVENVEKDSLWIMVNPFSASGPTDPMYKSLVSSGAQWIGTTEEYEIAKPKISDGTHVLITDDEVDITVDWVKNTDIIGELADCITEYEKGLPADWNKVASAYSVGELESTKEKIEYLSYDEFMDLYTNDNLAKNTTYRVDGKYWMDGALLTLNQIIEKAADLVDTDLPQAKAVYDVWLKASSTEESFAELINVIDVGDIDNYNIDGIHYVAAGVAGTPIPGVAGLLISGGNSTGDCGQTFIVISGGEENNNVYTRTFVAGTLSEWETPASDKWMDEIVTINAVGNQEVTFHDIDTTKAYNLYFETSSGSPVYLMNGSISGNNMTYMVGIPEGTPLPVVFKLRMIV